MAHSDLTAVASRPMHTDAARDARTVLRVKRKRHEDPADAFLFQHVPREQSKRRARESPPREQRTWRAEKNAHVAGLFRFAGTVNNITLPRSDARVIDAEWDTRHRQVALKRKRDVSEDALQSKKQQTESAPQLPEMAHFASMLDEYLKRALPQTVLLTPVNDIEPAHNIDGVAADARPSADDYVYDLYYREAPARTSALSQGSILRRKARDAVDDRPRADVRVPPLVGRAPAKDNHSPVPLPRVSRSDTSAPGFEHLEVDDDSDFDDWEELSLHPVALHGDMPPAGSKGAHTRRVKVATEDATLDDDDDDDDDDDSNDEDYYQNDYPDADDSDDDTTDDYGSE